MHHKLHATWDAPISDCTTYSEASLQLTLGCPELELQIKTRGISFAVLKSASKYVLTRNIYLFPSDDHRRCGIELHEAIHIREMMRVVDDSVGQRGSCLVQDSNERRAHHNVAADIETQLARIERATRPRMGSVYGAGHIEKLSVESINFGRTQVCSKSQDNRTFPARFLRKHNTNSYLSFCSLNQNTSVRWRHAF